MEASVVKPRWCRTSLPSMMPFALVLFLSCWPNSAQAKIFSMSITGDQGASFIGSCLAKQGDQHQVLALHGQVPFEQQIDAEFVSCRITARGRINVDVRSDQGQHRQAETKNGMITLSLH